MNLPGSNELCTAIFELPGPNELARAKWSCPGIFPAHVTVDHSAPTAVSPAVVNARFARVRFQRILLVGHSAPTAVSPAAVNARFARVRFQRILLVGHSAPTAVPPRARQLAWAGFRLASQREQHFFFFPYKFVSKKTFCRDAPPGWRPAPHHDSHRTYGKGEAKDKSANMTVRQHQ